MGSFSGQVAASTDDARCVSGGGSYNATVVSMFLGLFTATQDFFNGWRWTNVTVPNAATINSATLDLFSSGQGTGTGTAAIIFHGSAADNIATFATSTNYPGQIADTTASTSITISNPSTSFNVTGFSISPFPVDVTSIIQEIVNRAGWSSGNALAIVGHNNGSNGTTYIGNSTFDSQAARGATLAITYSTGGVTRNAGLLPLLGAG